jgi:hypothetical protein
MVDGGGLRDRDLGIVSFDRTGVQGAAGLASIVGLEVLWIDPDDGPRRDADHSSICRRRADQYETSRGRCGVV